MSIQTGLVSLTPPRRWVFEKDTCAFAVTLRQICLSAADTILLLCATFVAFGLHNDFEFTQEALGGLQPYLGATAMSSIIVVPASGLNKSIWRFGCRNSYACITAVVISVCLGSVTLCFFYDRLAGVARSLPFLQGIVAIVALAGVRSAYALRKSHGPGSAAKSSSEFLQLPIRLPEISLLIVEVHRLADTYIQTLVEVASKHVHVNVAGLIATTPGWAGRRFAGRPILGRAEEIESILDGLEIHGVTVDRIAVMTSFAELPEEAQKALFRVQHLRGIRLQLLPELLDLEPATRQGLSKTTLEIEPYSKRPFWKIKRVVDVLAALVLLLLIAPIMLSVALLVAVSAGFPVVFWQKRPGRRGKPFHLYKFRTMGAAHTVDGRRLSDMERVSRIGKFLRHTKLDELPQLFNILRGDMSFIGPRPLLPKDQPNDYATRLLVRPGLTGWAQVVGGRDIPAEYKLALDIWYVRHASFIFDLTIAARTIPVLLFGERISGSCIERARQELAAL